MGVRIRGMGRDPVSSCLTAILMIPFMAIATTIRILVNAAFGGRPHRRASARRAPARAGQKSYVIGLTLAVLFGAFGLLYVSLAPTILLVFLAYAVGIFVNPDVALLVLWLPPILWSPVAVKRYNDRLTNKKRRPIKLAHRTTNVSRRNVKLRE